MQDDCWDLLYVLNSRIRVQIVKSLMELEFRSLSEIAEGLEKLGWKMTLSGVIKHLRELEKAGIVRHESGVFAKKPDARKTLYFLEGKERIERLLNSLENDVLKLLQVGVMFSTTAKVAREIQRIGYKPSEEDIKSLESLIDQCSSEEVYMQLTEDERKKIRLWKMMIPIL